VGSRSFNTFGSHGSAEHVNLAYHATLEDCCEHLKSHEGMLPTMALSRYCEPRHSCIQAAK
jgi:hypothetical protein